MQGEARKPIRVVGRKIKKAEKGGRARQAAAASVRFVRSDPLPGMDAGAPRALEGRTTASCSLHVQCSRDSFITNPKEQCVHHADP